jgi:hypothetical protein
LVWAVPLLPLKAVLEASEVASVLPVATSAKGRRPGNANAGLAPRMVGLVISVALFLLMSLLCDFDALVDSVRRTVNMSPMRRARLSSNSTTS